MVTIAKSFLLFLGALVVIGLFIGYPVMWIMNYLFTKTMLQTVFGVSQMTFWRAFWLNVLCGFLFERSVKTKQN